MNGVLSLVRLEKATWVRGNKYHYYQKLKVTEMYNGCFFELPFFLDEILFELLHQEVIL